jgi:hypothetical protein
VPDMTESVDVAVTEQAYSRLGFRVPQTAIQGQFCMSYLLARVMFDGKVSIDAFTDTAVHDRRVRELAEKVHMRLDPDLSKNTKARLVSKVEIRLKNGQSFFRRVDYAKGSLVVPLTAEELNQKFLDCALGVLTEEGATQVLDCVIRLVPLPAYAPELNPQEHVWDELREKEFPNRVFNHVDAVIAPLRIGLPRLAEDHDRVRSLTAWPWIVSLNLTAS